MPDAHILPYKILYYAPDSAFDSPSQGAQYRGWAQQEIEQQFPEHAVAVLNEQARSTVQTDDPARREEIVGFVNALRERWE